MMEVDFQLLIWGYAVTGENEQDALLAEGTRFQRIRWDSTRADLDTCRIDRGRGWEPVPDWWALRYLPMEWREEALAG